MPLWIARIAACAALIVAITATPAHAGEQETARANNAVRVLKEIMQAPDSRIPGHLLRDAYAVAVIPDVIKAGLIIGGRHGLGLLSVKTPNLPVSGTIWLPSLTVPLPSS